MHEKKITKHIPNICTFLNAFCGILATLISVCYKSMTVVIVCCILIAIGGFFDTIDGFLARRLKVTSLMGKQLDSFADIITFGIAPITVFLCVYHLGMDRQMGVVEILLGSIYISCGIFRLARYNIGSYTDHFEGLPITACGILMSIYVLLSVVFLDFWRGHYIYMIVSFLFVVILSIAMVSSFKVKRI